jgi:hypothetical protein
MKITPTASSAMDYVLAESYLAPRFAMLSTFWYDIKGGITDKQYGMTLSSAKNALWDALVLFLMKRGVAHQTPTSHLATHFLLETAIEEPGLIEELDELLLRNPDTHEEVVAFAEACLRFIDDRLEMKRWRELYGDFTSWDQLAAYQRRMLDMAKMADEMGFTLPQSIEAVRERVEFRTEIEQRVAGKIGSGSPV